MVSAAQTDWVSALWDLPVTHWLLPAPSAAPALQPASAEGACRVEPLPPITDPEALEFEQSEVPNTAGLVPALSRALAKFEQLVISVGGSFELRSAYRPEAYQAHLQEVWYKWRELRYNRDPGCKALRAAVQEEFDNHHLMATQKPVTSSDHTRGLAFDATVVMPRSARLRRRRMTVDRLATLAGIMRPDVVHDPVHFKLVSASRPGLTE